MKASKSSPQNNSETIKSETEYKKLDREVPKERYISRKKQRTITDLRLI